MSKNPPRKGADITVLIDQQGAVRVGTAYCVRKSTHLAAVELTLHSKYTEVGSHFHRSDDSVGLYLNATAETRGLLETVPRDEPTQVSFPDFAGWRIFGVWQGNYTVNICFIKR